MARGVPALMYKGKKGYYKPLAQKKWRKRNAAMITGSLTQRVSAIIARNTDQKYIDTIIEGKQAGAHIGTNVSSAVETINVVCIQQGAAGWQRVGNNVKLQSLRLKGTLLTHFASDNKTVVPKVLNQLIGIAIVHDAAPRESDPTWEDVFRTIEPNGNTNSTVDSLPNTQNIKRFRVLWHETFKHESPIMTPLNVADDSGTGTTFEMKYGQGSGNIWYVTRTCVDQYIDLSKRGYEAAFKSTSNPVITAQMTKGAIYVMQVALNDSLAATSTTWSSGSRCRVRFTDA